MMNCPKCGYASVPEQSYFCPNCGQKIQAVPALPEHISVTQRIGNALHSTIVGVQKNYFGGQDGQQYRHLLLKRVRDRWLSEQGESLDDAVAIGLGMEERLDLLDRQPNRILPSNTQIIDVFDSTGRKLLILGASGSGKKEKLLELAQCLVERAEKHAGDDSEPMPVLLSLVSWPDELVSDRFLNWLVDEISQKYDGIGRKLCEEWIKERSLVLLIHGLDRVEPEHQDACVRAINDFVMDWDPVQIVVCSRTSEYEALKPPRLKFQGAIELQSLTSQQVDAYLAAAGPELAALRAALEDDWMLRELARSPLYLNIMSDIYRGGSVETVQPLSSIEARRKEIWVDYVDCAFDRRGGEQPYTRKQVESWLTWLAQKMKEHKQDLFLVERMQLEWLSTEAQRRLYILGSWLVTGLAFGLPTSLAFGLAFAQGVGLTDGLVSGLAFGLSLGLLGGLAFFGLVRRLIFALALGLTAGLAMGLAVGLAFGPIRGLVFGAIAAAAGLASGLLPSALTTDRTRIKVVEILSWSWSRAIFGLVIGATAALAAGAAVGLLIGLTNGLSAGLFFGFFIGPTLAVIGGMTGGEIQVEDKEAPNQGIRRSAKNAVRTGLLAGLAFGLPLGLAEPTIGPIHVDGIIVGGLRDSLAVGLTLGAVLGLAFGGITCIQHAILRLILYSKGYIPWDLVRFLEYTKDLGLLRRRGGAYEFRHQRLEDYFAELGAP
jgi:hypothetical protein